MQESQPIDPRRFGLVCAGLSLLVTVLGFLWLEVVLAWAVGCTAAFALLSLAAPNALLPLARSWLAFARLVGRINTHIVLGLIFFVILTPLALLMRLFRRDTLGRRKAAAADTWLTPVVRQATVETFDDQF